jgi:phage shock protein C
MITDMDENSGSGDKRLLRPREGRMAFGVCAGIAGYFGWDVNLVRLAFGVFAVFYGLGALIYILAVLVLPEEGEQGSILESFLSRHRQ